MFKLIPVFLLSVLAVQGCDLSDSPQQAEDAIVGIWVSQVEQDGALEKPEVWDVQDQGEFRLFNVEEVYDKGVPVEGCLIRGGSWEQDDNRIHVELSDTSFSVRYELKDGQLKTYHGDKERVWESWQPSDLEPIILSLFYNQGFCAQED